LRVNTNGSNYTDESIERAIKKQNAVKKAIKHAERMRIEGKEQVLIFAPSVDTSEYIASELGVDSVTSYTKSDNRAEYLRKFAARESWCLCDVNVLSVGYDNQKIDAIIDLAPTMSLARYYQKIGRGVRVDLSENPTKKDCMVVDLVGNVDQFGRVEDLVVENRGGWAMFSGNRQLTNVPLVTDTEAHIYEDETIERGRHAGKKFKEVPLYYLRWVYENWKRDQYTEKLFRYIESRI